MPERILIIGDSGLLGKALMRVGKERKLNIYGLSRNSPDFSFDASRVENLETVFSIFKPSIVINASGLIDIDACELNPIDAWTYNVRIPSLLKTVVEKYGARLIQISTDHYYTGDTNNLHSEDHPVRLINEYATTKYCAENIVLTYAKSLVIRTNIIGFRSWKGRPTFIEWLIENFQRGNEMKIYTDYYTSSLCANQLVQIIFNTLDLPISGVINFASRECFSKFELVEQLAKSFGYSMVNIQPASIKHRAGLQRAESLGLNIALAKKITGQQFPSLIEVVNELLVEYSMMLEDQKGR